MTSRKKTLLLVESERAGDVLRRLAPGDQAAIREGRVFVDRVRIDEETLRLDAGQTVIWCASRRQDPKPAAMASEPLLLGERDGVLAVYKPAEWSSEPDHGGTELSVSNYLSKRFPKRNIHVATRLDVGVSGLLLVATESQSRRYLSGLLEQGALHRCYLAIAVGAVPKSGQWTGAVEGPSRDKARHALTNYECLAQVPLEGNACVGLNPTVAAASLLRFLPQTGRRHQLRIHASRHGHPLFGDRRYGGPKQFVENSGRVTSITRILLQAVSTELPLSNGESWSLHCPVDEEVGRFWKLLGGKDVDIPR